MPELSLESRRLTVEDASAAVTLALAQFDAALGTLLALRVRVDGVVTGTFALENLEARTATLSVALPASVTVRTVDGIQLAAAENGVAPVAASVSLASFDGDADFAGQSGTRVDAPASGFSGAASVFDAATLAGFVGTGKVALAIDPRIGMVATGAANLRLLGDGRLDAAVTVEYGYVPAGTSVGNSTDWTFGSVSIMTTNPGFISHYTPPPSVVITTAAQRFVFADRTTGWQDRFQVARFDPSLGTLEGVEIRLSGNIAAGIGVENHGAGAAALAADQAAVLSLTWADGGSIPLAVTARVFHAATLGAGDGTDDFGGTGGWISPGRTATSRADLTIMNDRFIGTGTVELGIVSTGTSWLRGAADLLAELQARGGGVVEVVYRYLPADPAHFTVHSGETAVVNDLVSTSAVVITVEGDGALELRGHIQAPSIEIGVAAGGGFGVVASHAFPEFGGRMTASAVVIEGVGFAAGPFAGSGSVTAATLGYPELQLPTAALGCSVIDTRTNGQVAVTPIAYAGPVAGLDHELIRMTAENLNVAASTDNWFIRTGGGTDAIAAHGGVNVLDGGGGSNFLTGGAGRDTFFLDSRGATEGIWSTIVQFGNGDAATLWGVGAADTVLSWTDNEGAVGASGLTLHVQATGMPMMSVTLAGYTTAGLTNGTLLTAFGHDPISNSDYLYIVHG